MELDIEPDTALDPNSDAPRQVLDKVCFRVVLAKAGASKLISLPLAAGRRHIRRDMCVTLHPAHAVKGAVRVSLEPCRATGSYTPLLLIPTVIQDLDALNAGLLCWSREKALLPNLFDMSCHQYSDAVSQLCRAHAFEGCEQILHAAGVNDAPLVAQLQGLVRKGYAHKVHVDCEGGEDLGWQLTADAMQILSYTRTLVEPTPCFKSRDVAMGERTPWGDACRFADQWMEHPSTAVFEEGCPGTAAIQARFGAQVVVLQDGAFEQHPCLYACRR